MSDRQHYANLQKTEDKDDALHAWIVKHESDYVLNIHYDDGDMTLVLMRGHQEIASKTLPIGDPYSWFLKQLQEQAENAYQNHGD